MGRVKTIKVSDQELRILEQAKQILAREGYGKVASELQQATKDSEVRPPSDIGKFLGGMALGAIAAAGAIALIKMLTEEEGE